MSPNSNLNMTLPTDGRKVHVTLHSLIGGVYQSNFSWTYTAATQARQGCDDHAGERAAHLANTVAAFNWSAGTGRRAPVVCGSQARQLRRVYAGDEVTNLSKTITTMPTDRGPVLRDALVADQRRLPEQRNTFIGRRCRLDPRSQRAPELRRRRADTSRRARHRGDLA